MTYFSFSADKKKEKREFYDTVVLPLEVETSNLFLNVRYYSLSALSLRRYILGRMYIIMKTEERTDKKDRMYEDFLSVYKRILTNFETQIVQHLVEADI